MFVSRLQRRVYDLLDPRTDHHPLDRAFNGAVVLLILANVAAVLLESMADFVALYRVELVIFEVLSITLFSIEYVLRIWTAPLDPDHGHDRWSRFRFATSPVAVLDLLAVVPFYLAYMGLEGDLRLLLMCRIFRIFVLFKLLRYSYALKTLLGVLRRQRGELTVTLVAGFVLLVFAAGIMFQLEHDAQPKAFSSIPAAMWWGVITLTTVGYGDVYPITPMGKFVGGVFAVFGVGLFALPAGIIASGFAKEIVRQEHGPPCPHCGLRPEDHPQALSEDLTAR